MTPFLSRYVAAMVSGDQALAGHCCCFCYQRRMSSIKGEQSFGQSPVSSLPLAAPVAAYFFQLTVTSSFRPPPSSSFLHLGSVLAAVTEAVERASSSHSNGGFVALIVINWRRDEPPASSFWPSVSTASFPSWPELSVAVLLLLLR